MTSPVTKIQVLGNRILFAPFSRNQFVHESGLIVPPHLRPQAVEGIVLQIGTPHRGTPKRAKGREKKGHHLRTHASYLLNEIKVGDRVRMDDSSGHFPLQLRKRGKRGDTIACEIRSVLDVMFVYPDAA